MLKQTGPNEYEITPIVLDDEASYCLEMLMEKPLEGAHRRLEEATERARQRVTERPLSELLTAH